MTRGKAIVIMRARKRWLEAVPELATHQHDVLLNYRQPYVSAGNMQPGAFERLTATLLRQRQAAPPPAAARLDDDD